ncbi:YadA C-terminal domain-containing protein [Vibrio barjaei]|uniref:YadA C-terminal domain-containing protein n=1 Tax=Vibrio barjaei TaxID=1676683 RepID=UPI0007BAF1DB|nr:YadA C-terminal domain-containing protein [Vibrio barjaei]OIN23948.1 hypothetical protein AWH66_2002235 [Vibrio barjaei]
MKKTIIALSLTTLFAAPVIAEQAPKVIDMKDAEATVNYIVEQHNLSVDKSGDIYSKVYDHNGEVKEFVKVGKTDGKTYTVTDESTGETVAIDINSSKIDYSDSVGGSESFIVVPENNVIIDDPSNEYQIVENRDLENFFDENELVIDETGQIITKYGEGEVVGTVTNKDGEVEITSYIDGKKHTASIKKYDETASKVKVDTEDAPVPAPLPDLHVKVEDATAAARELEKIAAGAYTEATAAYSTLDNKIAANTKRIDSLEADMAKMGNKMLDLEDRMDGVVATSHAVTNARPMVQDSGEFAMGVGIGAAGSKQALALGGAYQFNANWSSSMTVNYETAGKRSNSQVSAGAGVQYRFK